MQIPSHGLTLIFSHHPPPVEPSHESVVSRIRMSLVTRTHESYLNHPPLSVESSHESDMTHTCNKTHSYAQHDSSTRLTSLSLNWEPYHPYVSIGSAWNTSSPPHTHIHTQHNHTHNTLKPTTHIRTGECTWERRMDVRVITRSVSRETCRGMFGLGFRF